MGAESSKPSYPYVSSPPTERPKTFFLPTSPPIVPNNLKINANESWQDDFTVTFYVITSVFAFIGLLIFILMTKILISKCLKKWNNRRRTSSSLKESRKTDLPSNSSEVSYL